ncbi:MAG: redoxin domain-containing protein [Pirellulaceae bacterium]
MNVRSVWAALSVSLVFIFTNAAAQEPKQLSTFERPLVDYRGKEWNVSDFAEVDYLVIAFLGTECPLAKLYSRRLQTLADKYSANKVAFLAIDPNHQDSLQEMEAFARRQQMTIPFVKDLEAKVAARMGATRTPEIFVLDSERKIQYQGRVDDQYGVGYTRNEPTVRELESALDELLAGKPVSIANTEAVGCLIGRSNESVSNNEVNYVTHVAPILNEHCVKCHREGQIGPFTLDNFDNAAAWRDMIGEVINDGRMPPWHANPDHGSFANDCSLSREQIEVLNTWIANGSPFGEGTAPKSPAFEDGWQLPTEPEFKCFVTKKPHDVPAMGKVEYQYFVHDPKFEEDKWIRAAELRPGNLEVVHHILCFILPPGEDDLGEGLDGFLVGYVPGMLPPQPVEGYAKKVPAGSRFVFQVHYTPNGRDTTDQSQLGLIFADESEVQYEVVTTCAVNPRIEIPPRSSDHEVKAINRHQLGDWKLLSLMPHMHLRGKSFRYEAIYPDGKKEVLLDVPQFDFNWQTSYQLENPKTLPRDTRIVCTAVYDNSEGNLSNPDPEKTVSWGDQTWEEMMIGYFDVAIPKGESTEMKSVRRRR